MANKDYDAIIIGSGPNGLAAAITMQQQGLSVLILEAKSNIGGGLRSEELTLPHFIHDVCSAIHPMAAASPFFNSLPLRQFGLEYIYPSIPAAHPFDDGSVALLQSSIEATANGLGDDSRQYASIMQPLVYDWPFIIKDVLAPLHFPEYPVKMAEFGVKGISSAANFVKHFKTKHAKGLWAGMAAHSMQPLSNMATSAIALVLMITAHTGGWPVAKGGSISIANALISYFKSLGGIVETNNYVNNIAQLPSSHVLLFDVTPKQLLEIAGNEFSALYKWQLQNYRYGMGVFKIDWALDAPIPFTAEECKQAGTVHLGNTYEEIAESEYLISKGKHPERPFVLLGQQSKFDSTRAPNGKQTGWAYCHVPNGSIVDMTEKIENQVERFAPGFKNIILARHVMNTNQIEAYNPNYVGGDINGGVIDITQLFTRPVIRLSPYNTSAKGIYLCSSSTPPGGGVHGMCGYHAAKKALKDIFDIRVRSLHK